MSNYELHPDGTASLLVPMGDKMKKLRFASADIDTLKAILSHLNTPVRSAWEQRILSNPLHARLTDPSTSHEAVPTAAQSASIQEAVLDAAKSHPEGGTEEEYSEWTGIARPTISPQFRPMIREGRMVDMLDADGNKLKRKNSSGKMALVRGLS